MESTSPAQLDTVSQPEAPAASRYSLRWLFFPLALLYHELLLRAFDSSTVFFDAALAPTALTALGLGLLISLLANALPCRRVSRWAALILTLLWTVCVCVEYCCKSYFKSYFALTFMVTMTGHVVGDFAGTIPDVVLPRLPFILLALVPPVLAIVLRRRIVPEDSMGRRGLLVLALLALLTLGGGDAVGRFGPSAALFTYDFNTNSAVPRFGLNTALRLELTYAVTGVPTPPLEPLPEPDPEPEPEPTPVDYGYNMLDIDFTALAESTGDSTLASLHRYMAARTPSRQNQYTGMFAGKNLILLTAESFSPWFISQELTPTLYRLTHEGFVFSNYYQPGWGQSTTGGEFAVLTGLLPTWVGGDVSFWASRYDYMPLALGNQFRGLGYQTPAWHNNTYNYYGRNATHPNLGYDYEGIGSGLTLATQDSSWPYSDLEMLEATLDSCVDAYLTTGQPFHTYYMTVSGHGSYNWGQSMAAKNRLPQRQCAGAGLRSRQSGAGGRPDVSGGPAGGPRHRRRHRDLPLRRPLPLRAGGDRRGLLRRADGPSGLGSGHLPLPQRADPLVRRHGPARHRGHALQRRGHRAHPQQPVRSSLRLPPAVRPRHSGG